jgi:hypothetical protein
MMYRWARLPVLLTTLLVLFLSTPATAHTVEVGASKKECFFEDLHTHDQVPNDHPIRKLILTMLQMTVTYQVGGGGHMDIDFWVGSLTFELCVAANGRT